MPRSTISLLLSALLTTPLAAATPYRATPWLVDDIGTELPQFPSMQVQLGVPVANGLAYFSTYDRGESGYLGWISDGTRAGTRTVHFDLLPSPSRYLPQVFFLDDQPYYHAWTEAQPETVTHWRLDSQSAHAAYIPSMPSSFGTFNVLVPFAGQTAAFDCSSNRTDLYMTDGTDQGTRLIQSFPSYHVWEPEPEPIVWRDRLYFYAGYPDELIGGISLWESDGTKDNTRIVQSELPYFIEPLHYTPYVGDDEDGVFFVLKTSVYTKELYHLNAPGDEPVRLIDLHEGDTGGAGFFLGHIGHRIIFVGIDNQHGMEPWVTEGTPETTHLLKDIYEGAEGSCTFGDGDYSHYIGAAYNGRFYFYANDGVHGYEMWSTDETEAGTRMVADYAPGPKSSYDIDSYIKPIGPHTLEAGVVFLAGGYDGTYSYVDLCRIEGPEETLTTVYHFDRSNAYYAALVPGPNGTALISLDDRHQLWVTDGTEDGTRLLRDFETGSISSDPTPLHPVSDGNLCFLANYHKQAWVTRGDGADLLLTSDRADPADIGVLADIAGRLLISDGDSGQDYSPNRTIQYRTLWSTDGTTEGTFKLLNADFDAKTGYIRSLASLPDRHVFLAGNGDSGPILMTTDGSTTGTTLLRDITPHNNAPYIRSTTVSDGRLYIHDGTQLWETDGTPEGTTSVAVSSATRGYMVATHGKIVYDQTGPDRLYSYDPEQGTTQLINSLPIGSGVYILHLWTYNDQGIIALSDSQTKMLWTTDGTPAGTSRLARYPDSSYLPAISYAPSSFGNAFFFNGVDDERGVELWISDGTVGGTHCVADLNPGNEGSSPQFDASAYLGKTFLFTASTPEEGRELRRTDGTQLGTVLVRDIAPGPDDASIHFGSTFIREVNGTAIPTAFLLVNTQETGIEPWVTDGTEAGTYSLGDLNPGPVGSISLDSSYSSVDDDRILAVGGRVYFAAGTVEHGVELWVTDGTLAGTHMVSDIAPGEQGSSPTHLAVAGDTLYFSADDHSGTGRELWATRINGSSPLNAWIAH